MVPYFLSFESEDSGGTTHRRSYGRPTARSSSIAAATSLSVQGAPALVVVLTMTDGAKQFQGCKQAHPLGGYATNMAATTIGIAHSTWPTWFGCTGSTWLSSTWQRQPELISRNGMLMLSMPCSIWQPSSRGVHHNPQAHTHIHPWRSPPRFS